MNGVDLLRIRKNKKDKNNKNKSNKNKNQKNLQLHY